MSMPALLSHFGIDKARFVTTTGQVVFDGVRTHDTGGFTHVDYGTVTPVARHTFHGGTDEPSDSLHQAAWWDDEKAITRHVEAMECAFPGFIYLPADDDMAPCWVGVVDTGRGRFKIGILLRRDRGLPFVRLVDGPRLGVNAGRRWVPSPHLFLNGNLCIADQNDWNPDVHTAATAAGWAAHWLAAYTEWRITRRWPVEGVHAVAS